MPMATITSTRKEEPIVFYLLTGTTFCAISFLSYLLYNLYYKTPPGVAAYPDKVQNLLRYAIFNTEINFDPDQAFKSFTSALKVAEQEGMDPLSNEVLGIRIRLTAMLEKAGRVKTAVEILEQTAADCLAFVEEWDGGKIEKVKEAVQGAEKAAAETGVVKEEEAGEDRRARLFKKAIECRTKAAELYDSDFIQDPGKAQDMLAKTFEMVLREAQRTKTDVPRGMTKIEVASIIEPLAELYLRASMPGLATPLYLHALQLLREDEGEPSCKQVLLMTNIASSLAASKALDARLPDALTSNAKQWAEKSLEVAAYIKPPERDQQCDLACVTATFHLAEIARTSGNKKEAKKKYDEAISLAKGLGQHDAVQRMMQSMEGMK
ncbi:MAG: hypothetical protein Q9227_003400 [Pyrenula ochraceoflavens]